MISILALHLVCKWSSHLSSDPIQGVQDLQDPNLYMVSQWKWPETITSRMWLSEKPERKMYTNMRSVRGLKGAFGANYMKTSIPLL